MLPLRSFTMTIVGLIALGLGVGAWLSPESVSAQFGQGWLYQHLGLLGVAGTLIVIGLVLLVWGGAGMVRAFKNRRHGVTDPTQ